MSSAEQIILVDADVVSHFITAGEAGIMYLIFPDCKLYMLDIVHQELQNWPNPLMDADAVRFAV